jgi:hypothetical protein
LQRTQIAKQPPIINPLERRPAMNGADTAWIIVATALVLFMTLPGLALF